VKLNYAQADICRRRAVDRFDPPFTSPTTTAVARWRMPDAARERCGGCRARAANYSSAIR
jgi:hypothetical protein